MQPSIQKLLNLRGREKYNISKRKVCVCGEVKGQRSRLVAVDALVLLHPAPSQHLQVFGPQPAVSGQGRLPQAQREQPAERRSRIQHHLVEKRTKKQKTSSRDSPPRHNQQPVEVVSRNALGVVLPHVDEVVFDRLRRRNENGLKAQLRPEKQRSFTQRGGFRPSSLHPRCCSRAAEPRPGRPWTGSAATRSADVCGRRWDNPPCGKEPLQAAGVCGSPTVGGKNTSETGFREHLLCSSSQAVLHFTPNNKKNHISIIRKTFGVICTYKLTGLQWFKMFH